MKKTKMNKKNLYGKANYNEDTVKSVKILLAVVSLFAVIYLVTAVLTGEIDLSKKDNTEKVTTIQYDEILAGQIFNRNAKEYYVIFFNFTDTASSSYLTLRDAYKEKTGALPVYSIDTEKGFNTFLVAANDEKFADKPSSLDDLKVKVPTMIKISNKKVVERIETKDKIKEKLEQLAK